MDNHLFSGLRVIDCATVIAAPAAAMILGDFGADVIKVEQPGEGDMLRMLSDISTTPDAGTDWFWQMDGRNKRALCVEMKSEEGREIIRRLVAGADVFITNHPYPVRESLGLTYESLREINEGLIYASLTAYGEQGPERDRKGFDQLAYWARSGLMDLMREPGTRPTQGLPGMGDHPTGVALYAGIVTALLHRERTGEGSMVHTSLLANGLWSAAGIAQGAMAGGDMAAYRDANDIYPPTLRPYQAADGRWLQCNMVRDETMLAQLLAALDALHLLADERFATLEDAFGPNKEAFGDALAEIFATKPAVDWVSICRDAEVPVNLVAVVEETVTDPQIEHNAMTVAPNDPDATIARIIDHPINVSSVAQVGPRRAPELGEHAAEVLAELGYSDDEVSSLAERGII